MEDLIHIIGIIRNNDSEIIKYRLYNYATGQVSNIPIQNFIDTLKAGKAKVENISIDGDNIVADYNLDKLPSWYYDGTPYGYTLSNLTILDIIDDNIVLVDYTGELIHLNLLEFFDRYSNTEVVNYNLLNTILKIEEKQLSPEVCNEVSNPDKEWSLLKFVNYMKYNNYSFELFHLHDGLSHHNLTNYTLLYRYDVPLGIRNISPECKVIHLPKNIKVVDNLYSSNPESIKTLIINGDIREFKCICPEQLVDEHYTYFIDTLHFQYSSNSEGKSDTFDMQFTKGIIVRKNYNLPSYKKFKNMFNMARLLHFTGYKFVELENSCNNLKIYQENEMIIHCDNIINCFNNLQGILKVVINTYGITNSFNNCTFNTLSTGKDLGDISFTDSINNCANLMQFIDNHCCGYRLNNSFNSCDRLKEFNFYMRLNKFNTNSLNTENLTINIRELARVQIEGEYRGHKIIISDVCITGGKLDKIYKYKMSIPDKLQLESAFFFKLNSLKPDEDFKANILNKVIKIGRGALSSCNLDVFDTAILPNVHSIDSNFLLNSEYQHIIINSNILTMQNDAMHYLGNTKTVFIGDTVTQIFSRGVNNKALDVSEKGKFPIQLYVIKNSYAHLWCKEHRIKVNIVDSLNDYLSIINKHSVSQKSLMKYNMVLNGSDKYRWLLQEEYIKNIEFLYTLARKSDAKTLCKDYNVTLNKNKYKDLGIKLNSLDKVKENYLNGLGTITEDNPRFRYFISINNLFNQILDNDLRTYTEYFKNYLIDLDNSNKITVILMYADDANSISVLRFRYRNKDIELLCIEYNYEIVFLNTITLYNSREYNFDLPCALLNYSSKHIIDDSLLCNLEVNDTLLFDISDSSITDMTCSSIDIPQELLNKHMNDISAYRFICVKRDEVGMGRNYTGLAWFIDVLRCKLIEARIKACSSHGKLTQLKQMQITKIIDIDNINSKTLSKLTTANVDAKIHDMIEFISMGGECGALTENKNYSPEEDRALCDIADIIYQNHILKVEDCSQIILSQVLKLPFMEPIELKKKEVEKCTEPPEIKILRDSKRLLILPAKWLKYRGSYNTYLILLDDVKSVYVCGTPLDNIIKMLNYMGECRNIMPFGLDYCKIVEKHKKINPDEFYFTKVTSINNITSCKFHLAIHKITGYTYLIYDYMDMEFYTVFRFIDYKQAEEWFIKLSYYTLEDLDYLASYIKDNEDYEKIHKFNTCNYIRIYKDIVENGLPVGYPYINDDRSFFDILARQPIK